jgi:hypothetical protein
VEQISQEQIFQLPPSRGSEAIGDAGRDAETVHTGARGFSVFTYFYLHWLPQELRVLLTDRQVLAAKAHQLWNPLFQAVPQHSGGFGRALLT